MESSSDFFLRLAWTQFLPQLPVYLVWLIGLFLALVRWRRHPVPSLLALIAFILFLVSSMAGTLLTVWVMSQMGNRDIDRAWMSSLIALGRIAVGTVAWILLLLALFGWRTPPQPRHRPREEPLDTVLPAVPDTGIREGRSG
jgi:hypothetical protein